MPTQRSGKGRGNASPPAKDRPVKVCSRQSRSQDQPGQMLDESLSDTGRTPQVSSMMPARLVVSFFRNAPICDAGPGGCRTMANLTRDQRLRVASCRTLLRSPQFLIFGLPLRRLISLDDLPGSTTGALDGDAVGIRLTGRGISG